ncbi:MAG: hypothetical protein LBQ65_06390 [Tannerellaceae bacterium]|jgi:hypothetical protein|nr:hypothetical protein [Tannerellaceae bacterium]
MKRVYIIGIVCLSRLGCFAEDPQQNRWSINASGGITWTIDHRLPHADHIEMSGDSISVVLRYGVDRDSAFVLERSLVFPMLRTLPNDTHASLMRRFGCDLISDLTVNGKRMSGEKIKSISLNGLMRVVGEWEDQRNGKIQLTRYLFPSPTQAAYCEKYVLRNNGQTKLDIELPRAQSLLTTNPLKGTEGEYHIAASLSGLAGGELNPGDSLVFYAVFKAYKKHEAAPSIEVEAELAARRSMLASLSERLILQTPDETINSMFAFAKIRASESIYHTGGGYMHGPGGESYYAAIWANDQAEYVNPFFPFLGYEKGNRSALNAFRHFARFMNEAYKPIPSSIIAEGTDIWHGAGDRGDGAMIAYGAARYALAKGDRQEAVELWPLIEWCLEYCRRQLNEEGVVTSDSDELEGRFPAGKANLTTSSLYYDALRSAVHLGKDLGKPATQLSAYAKQAKDLRTAIDRYFGGTVEGFSTYKYYKENELLRSWICVPLTVGIYERKDETLKALFSARLWTANGLLTQAGSQTFWDRSTLYALRGVFACGETEKATDYLKFYSRQRLLGEHVPYAIEAWPEGSQRHLSAESGLYCRIITEGLLGIRPTGLRSFSITPHLPQQWNHLSLSRIAAFNSSFDLALERVKGKIKLNIRSGNRTVFSANIKEGETVHIHL